MSTLVETRTDRDRAVRAMAIIGIAGALGYLALAAAQAVASPPPDLADTLAALCALLLVGGVVGLARSRVAGDGWPARIGLGLAAVGWVMVAAGYVVSGILGAEVTVLFAIGTGLLWLGMLLAGVAVLRAGVWRGWRRIVPLLSAGYLLVAMPLFGVDGPVGYLAGAGLGVCWLLIGVALLAPRK